MVAVHEQVSPTRSEASDALVRARMRAAVPQPKDSVIALQRAAGNAAVSALMAARFRAGGGEARERIDRALGHVSGSDPDVGVVEKGLREAKALGIPVDLDGLAQKPPASALAVVTTGFGPGSVAAKKPVPPRKPVPAKSPLAAKPGAAKAPGPSRVGPGGAIPASVTVAAGGAAAMAAPTVTAVRQPPVAPTPVRPQDDPAFTQVTGSVKNLAKAKKSHPPAAAKAKEAQDAALPPAGDVSGQAKAAKLDVMDSQPAGTFDKKAFIAAVKAAIEAKSPKTLSEADTYTSSGKAGEVKNEVKGLVTQGKEGQAKDIEAATEAPPDESKAVPKPVTPMGPEQPGAAGAIPAGGAVPKPAPPDQLNLEAGKHQANQEMAEGEVTESQLAQSNEPDASRA